MDYRQIFTACIAGAAILSASAASAATLDGASFTVDYLFPDASTVYSQTNGPINGTVGDGIDAAIIVENVTTISLDFDALSLHVVLNTTLENLKWNPALFNGLRITFTDLPAAIRAFDLVSSDISPVTPTFSEAELFISWPEASYQDGDKLSFSVALVPLPAALPLMLAGLAGLGAISLRRGRHAGV
jgi:hypothetical protein